MQLKIYILFFQYFIFGNEFRYLKAKAIVGHNVRPAEENEFPSVVCIFKYDPDETWENNLLCTGTLISSNHILTVQHCLDMANTVKIEVNIGGHHVHDAVRYYPIWWISYNQWISRPQQTYSIVHDILIVKIFGLPININHCVIGYVFPIATIVEQNLNVVGCGKIENNQFPTILRTAAITVLDSFLCEERVSYYHGEHINIEQQIICTANDPYTLVNHGDSGGPLIYNGVIIGITVARCPEMENDFDSEQVNIHLNIYFYESFIYALLAM